MRSQSPRVKAHSPKTPTSSRRNRRSAGGGIEGGRSYVSSSDQESEYAEFPPIFDAGSYGTMPSMPQPIYMPSSPSTVRLILM